MFGDEAKLTAERRSERVDTAYSPRVHEEEPSDAANERCRAYSPRFREEEPSSAANLLQQVANGKRNGLSYALVAGRRRMQTVSFGIAEIRVVRARNGIEP